MALMSPPLFGAKKVSKEHAAQDKPAEEMPVRHKDSRFGEYEERRWTNWSETNVCKPKKIFHPKKVEEVLNIIEDANIRNIQVRFLGSGHSWSDLLSSEGYLVNTDAFDKILSINYGNGRVQVEGGIKLKNLFKLLAKEKLALPVQGFIAAQSIAGATATGTHGSGHLGPISDSIVAMKIIDAQGKLHVITQEQNPELLQAARVNLGALGWVYSITLQCVPLFTLEHKRTMMPWSEILPNFMEMYNNNDFIAFMWHPITPNALVYEWKRTDLPPTDNDRIKLAEKIFFNKFMNYFSIQSAHYAPGLTNKFMDFVFGQMQMPAHREHSYISLSPITSPQKVESYLEGEVAVPIENFPQALKDTKRLYDQYKLKFKGFELVSVMLCRFAKATTRALLNQNYDRDTAYICIATLNKIPGYEQFYTDWQLLMLKYGGRPHWGKINCLNKDMVKLVWGDNAAQFNEVRKQFDPQGIFANEFVRECFFDEEDEENSN